MECPGRFQYLQRNISRYNPTAEDLADWFRHRRRLQKLINTVLKIDSVLCTKSRRPLWSVEVDVDDCGTYSNIVSKYHNPRPNHENSSAKGCCYWLALDSRY